MTRILIDVQKSLDFEDTSGALYRTEAFILDNLGDPYKAIDSLRKAVACAEKDSCAQLRLAEFLREEQHLEDAVEQTEPLIRKGLLLRKDISVRNRARLFRAHYVSLLWLKRYEQVLEMSADWKGKGDLRPAHLALRVSAIQRLIDDQGLVQDSAEDHISEMLDSLAEGFRLDGYLPDTVHEGFRALDRLCRMEARMHLTERSLSSVSEFLNLHLPAMCGSSNEHALSDDFIKELVTRFRHHGHSDNPLNSARWSDLVIFGQEDDDALVGAGYVACKVTRVLKTYLFAQGLENSTSYFVPGAVTDLSPGNFESLKEGQLLYILPSDSLPEPGRATLAKHAMLD